MNVFSSETKFVYEENVRQGLIFIKEMSESQKVAVTD